MRAKSPFEDNPLKQVEREIIQGEIRIVEQRALILSLRTQRLPTAEVERVLDRMEAKIVELWALRAAIIQAINQSVPEGRLQ